MGCLPLALLGVVGRSGEAEREEEVDGDYSEVSQLNG